MKWRHRLAGPADAEKLAEIDAAASSDPWSAAQFTAACTRVESHAHGAAQDTGVSEGILLIEHSAQVGGFVVYSRVLEEGSIHNIAVLPHCRRQGAAHHLLQAVLVTLANLGVERCLLEVRASNIAARSLYRDSGFQVDGVRKNYYPSKHGREDALLMSKALL